MRTLVLGMGNPILTDDSVGLKVARAIQERLNDPGISVQEADIAGLNLLDVLAGYDRAIIIDAIQTRGGGAGEIYRFGIEALQKTRHAACSHGIDLITAIDLGKRLGLELPEEIEFFAIEVADVSTFGEQCTPKVEQAIPACAELVLERLAEVCLEKQN